MSNLYLTGGRDFHKRQEDLDDLPRYISQEDLDRDYRAGKVNPTDYTLIMNELLQPTIYEGGQPDTRTPGSNVINLTPAQFKKIQLLTSLEEMGFTDEIMKEAETALVKLPRPQQQKHSKYNELIRTENNDVFQAFNMIDFNKNHGRSGSFLLRLEGAWERLKGTGSIENYMRDYSGICTDEGIKSSFMKDLKAQVDSFASPPPNESRH